MNSQTREDSEFRERDRSSDLLNAELSLNLLKFLGDVVREFLLRFLVLFVEISKLSFELNDLILDHLDTALVVILVKDVTSNDEVLRAINAMLLLAVPGDEVGILRNNRGPLLVLGTLRVLVDVFERLGHDSDKQIQHHNVHN